LLREPFQEKGERSITTGKEITMSNQPENEKQQPETMTVQEIRESILIELEASKQTIAELSDEELKQIAGAGNIGSALAHAHANINALLNQPIFPDPPAQPAPHPAQPGTPASSMALSGPSRTSSNVSRSPIMHSLPILKRSHSAYF
jgi:hypothetical protein